LKIFNIFCRNDFRKSGFWSSIINIKLIFLLRGIPIPKLYGIEWGDTLRNPLHLENERLMKFDKIVSNPPFSLDKWGAEDLTSDIYMGDLEWDYLQNQKEIMLLYLIC
jgi:type I restriction-modification system DNA methylase subunit